MSPNKNLFNLEKKPLKVRANLIHLCFCKTITLLLVCVCVLEYVICVDTYNVQKVIRSSGVGVIGSGEPPDLGARN